jgi:hypothetical protein
MSTGPIGATFPFQQTPELFTGNPATVNDLYSTTPSASGLLANGARMAPGTRFYQTDSAGRLLKFRYVRYNPTAAVVLTLGTNVPGVVYWKDNTFTIVTPTASEGISTKINQIAGYLLNANATAGNFVCIQVAGYLANAVVSAGSAIDDLQVGNATTPLITSRTASGNYIPARPVAVTLAAISGNQAPVLVCIEDI